MYKAKPLILTMSAALVLTGWALTQPGCGGTSDVQQISAKTEPLRVRRSGGKVESITFAHKNRDGFLFWTSDPSKV